MAIQLKDEEIVLIKTLFRENLPDVEVWVFGSRSLNTASHYSDLDLLLKGKGPLSLGALARLSEQFEESNLPFKVELVDWERVSDEFKSTIQKSMERLI